MKKLNNNGFAISTILYGLIIIVVLMMGLLISTMAFSRNNSKKLVNKVIDDLEKRPLKIKVKKIVADVNPNIEVNNIYAGTSESYWVVIEIKNAVKVTKRNRKSNQDIVGSVNFETLFNTKTTQFEYNDITSNEDDGVNTYRIHISGPKDPVSNVKLLIFKGVFVTSEGNSNDTVAFNLGAADFDKFNINHQMISEAGGMIYTVSISVKRDSGIPVSDELLDKLRNNTSCYANNGYNKFLLNSGTEINRYSKTVNIKIKVDDYKGKFNEYTPSASISCTINGFDGSDQLMATDRLDFDTGYEFCYRNGKNCKWWIQKWNNVPYY